MPLYSVFAHVPYTLGVLEIVTPRLAPELAARGTRAAAEARFPGSAFAIANVNLSLPVAARARRPCCGRSPCPRSRATWRRSRGADARDLDLSRDEAQPFASAPPPQPEPSPRRPPSRFYGDVMLATELHYQNRSASHGRMYKLWHATVGVRFVEAADDARVTYVENVKKDAHNASYIDYACGTDRCARASRGHLSPRALARASRIQAERARSAPLRSASLHRPAQVLRQPLRVLAAGG